MTIWTRDKETNQLRKTVRTLVPHTANDFAPPHSVPEEEEVSFLIPVSTNLEIAQRIRGRREQAYPSTKWVIRKSYDGFYVTPAGIDYESVGSLVAS